MDPLPCEDPLPFEDPLKPFGNSVDRKMINVPTWPDAGLIMTSGMVSVEREMINAPSWPDAGLIMTCDMVSERLHCW